MGKYHKQTKKYDALTTYLAENQGTQVTLTFTQLDELLFPASGLPQTAHKHAEWWANDYKYADNGAYGWLNAGYEVIRIDLEKEFIVFKKLLKEGDIFRAKRQSKH